VATFADNSDVVLDVADIIEVPYPDREHCNLHVSVQCLNGCQSILRDLTRGRVEATSTYSLLSVPSANTANVCRYEIRKLLPL